MQEETMFTELTYRALLEMLNEHGWKYREAEDRTIICLTQGDDLPIPITFRVDDERKLLTVVSPIPVAVPEAKRTDMAVAVSLANYIIVDGSFDFDFLEGTMLFRLTSSFRESLIGKELLEYMLMVSCVTVDRFNDRFDRVAKEDLSREEIVALVQQQ